MTLAAESYGCVIVPQLAAQAAVRLRAHLAAAPLVVMEGKRPQERVFGLTEPARRLGISEGMTRVEVETFGGVVMLARSTLEEQGAQELLLEALATYTPRIERAMSDADCECVLDLCGTERLLGDSAALGRRMIDHLGRVGFKAWLVIGGNIDAARSLARMLAWTGSGRTVEVIAPGHAAKVLATLSLAVLKLDEQASERFQTWGIASLGELAALPETALITRMGQPGKQLRLRARGELPHLLEPAAEPLALAETLELEETVETLEPLLFLLNPMLGQLLLRAQERALALAAVTVELSIELAADRELGHTQHRLEEQRFTRTICPAIPTVNRPLLLKMLQLDLEANPAPGAVRVVRLTAEAGDTSRIQLGLFEPQMPEPTRFEDTHARLVALVGEANVGRVKPLDTHAVESFTLERFRLPAAGYKAPRAKAKAARPVTALRRMRPPIEVRVNLVGDQITWFWLEARRYDVVRCYGPWRMSGDWWHGRLWSLDTWDLAARDPVADELLVCLVGRDLVRNHWQLEGVYD